MHRDWTWLLGLVVLAGAGCKKERGQPRPTPSAADDAGPSAQDQDRPANKARGSRALTLHGDELQAIAADGSHKVVAKVPEVESCSLDRHHGVVWLLGDSLWAFDVTTSKVFEVATNTGEAESWGVIVAPDAPDGYPTKVAGPYDGLSICSALVLTIGPKPTIGGVYVGEGDREVYCGEYKGDGDAKLELFDEEKKKLAAYNKAVLKDSAFVASLTKRLPMADPPAPKPPTDKPELKIDPSQCEVNPEDCGEAQYLGGSIWKITTSNSRGDFFHEGYQLYDGKTKQFWDLGNDQKQKAPYPEDSQFFHFEVAPDGTWALYEDKRVSLEEARVLGPFAGELCGWM